MEHFPALLILATVMLIQEEKNWLVVRVYFTIKTILALWEGTDAHSVPSFLKLLPIRHKHSVHFQGAGKYLTHENLSHVSWHLYEED